MKNIIKIFVTLGSQKFQFNRLLSALDNIPTENYKVFAQIGYSDYKPSNFEFVDFLTRDEFANKVSEADLIITHAGTGAIVTALKHKKKVLAVPRLSKYGEHVDNHQMEILNVFVENNYIKGIIELDRFEDAILETLDTDFAQFASNTENFVKGLISLIES